jgi:RNA polymerase sigma-70 factor (ECF subfamily)
MDSGDDVELVARCLRGEVEAFAPLVERYQRVLYNLALRMLGDREDARDATQTAFVRAYEKLATYDSSHRFFSWIYRIVLNECLNQKQRRPFHESLSESLAASDSPYREAEAHETSARVQAGLLRLPAELREVLILRHFLDLSYGDIGAALHLQEKTVKSRLYSARQRLGQILLGEGTTH